MSLRGCRTSIYLVLADIFKDSALKFQALNKFSHEVNKGEMVYILLLQQKWEMWAVTKMGPVLLKVTVLVTLD